ncbi:MAG: hypothetical protein A2Y54_11095 [Chloroflexi bacterium RBG_16_51_16]|nr:MAG: hypothetical protein A2Y54_11095 [Chloroflexi bacterium RBG_16_51_16]
MPHRNKNFKRQFPWPFVVFGVILLVTAVFLYSNLNQDKGTPSLALNTELIDFGDVKLDDSRAFTINITNTGNGTLKFREKPYIEIREGC